MTVRVSPTESDPTHHISLSDGKRKLGLILVDNRGQRVNRFFPLRGYPVERTAIKTSSGNSTYSDQVWPYMSLVQQDWSGGRGSEVFEDNTARFNDNYRTEPSSNGLILGGRETYGTGYRSVDQVLPGDLNWQILTGDTRYMAASFAASASYNTAKIEMWVRKVGNPGTLTVGLYSDSGSAPNAALKTVTKSVVDITSDVLSVFYAFNFTGTQAVVSGTTYWVVIFGASTDDAHNHWEVGCGSTVSGSYSSNGSSWTTASGHETIHPPYYRVTGTDAPFVALFFEYKGQLYYATRPDSGAAGTVWMNGYRGCADSNGADKTYLYDSTQTGWTSALAGAVAQIYDGRGTTEMQNWRTIVTGASGMVEVSPDWNIAHLNSGADVTQYNILGSNVWTLQQTGTDPFHDVASCGELVYLCSGESRTSTPFNMYKLNEYAETLAGTWTKRWTTENLQASFLLPIMHPTNGWTLYLARNNDSSEDVSVLYAKVPKDYSQNLVLASAYTSASTYGFMTEQNTRTPLSSDSFNRADGAIGTTDGAGHTTGVQAEDKARLTTGGGSDSWNSRFGTWTVTSNAAKSSVLGATYSLATTDAGVSKTNCVVAAALTRSAGNVGVVARYEHGGGTPDFIVAYHNGTSVLIDKCIAGSITNVTSATATYVAGAVMKLECDTTLMTVWYNGTKVIDAYTLSDAEIQTGTEYGLYTSDITNTFDNFHVYEDQVTVDPSGGSVNTATIHVPAAHSTGILCTDVIVSADWRRYTNLFMRISSTKAMAAGELQLIASNVANCASAVLTEPFPILNSGQVYDWIPTDDLGMFWDISNTAGANAIISVGLNLTVDPTTDFDLTVTFVSVAPGRVIIPLGDKSQKITGMERWGDPEVPWVFKEGSLWEIAGNVANQVPLRELESVKSMYNGRAHTVNDVFLYFSFGRGGIERYYRQQMDDIGPDKDAGMPSDRQGHIAHMVSDAGRIYAAYDGGDGNYSSVLCYRSNGWYELYRAPRVGLRIRRLHIQSLPNSSTRRLWISMGADVLWIPISLNPYRDPDFNYTHEGSLTMAPTYGHFKALEKLFKDLKIQGETFTENMFVKADYRLDETTTWTELPDTFDTEPSEKIPFDAGNPPNTTGKRLQTRLRLESVYENYTPRVEAAVIEAFGKMDIKYGYSINVLLSEGEFALTLDDEDDDDFASANERYEQLVTWAKSTTPLFMESVFPPAHEKLVNVNAPQWMAKTYDNVDEPTTEYICQITINEL